MSSTWGNQIQISLFGESHGPAVGAVIDGLPPGFPVDFEALEYHMARRAPGKDPSATARKEPDKVRILSGLLEGCTTGAPLCGIIENTNTRSADYQAVETLARPGHADYTGHIRYAGFNDKRGGGHFSGRLTAPIVFAGSILRQILEKKGICIGAHIQAIGSINSDSFNEQNLHEAALLKLHQQRFPLLSPGKEIAMRHCIEDTKKDGDSVGGIVECAAIGIKAGHGDPFFHSVESIISQLFFSVPAVKGVEFGSGFSMAAMRGSQANDPFFIDHEKVATTTNHNGGINGGITNGMPIIVRAVIKPTPSIYKPQQTINYQSMQNGEITVKGRHDPCIVPRAVPVLESMLAIGLAEIILKNE